jgi:predicted dehydrogenase
MSLKAVVIGAGWAGEGHTIALRGAGVEVVAMCGRTREPALKMAAKLDIPEMRFDWRQALDEFQPMIVAIATPATLHREMAEAAANLGCHIICDKPLATNVSDARAMLLTVEKAKVKHAYGATSRYSPAVLHARDLVSNGFIGQVREIECSVHFNMASWRYSWLHELNQGGGMLNNVFPHKIAQIIHVTGGVVQAVMGQSQRLVERAPVGPTVHDFRDLFSTCSEEEQAQPREWRSVDADTGCTVILQLEMPGGYLARAVFVGSGASTHPYPDHLTFYGTTGALCLTGPNSPDHIQYFDPHKQEWREEPIPQEIIESLPEVEDIAQRNWNQLFREFVADVRGEGYMGYPTFREGWIDGEIIDIVRSGRTWAPLPNLSDFSNVIT